MSNDIKNIFLIRDVTFYKHTIQILEMIPNVLEGIIHYLEIEEEAEQGNLIWEDIARFDSEKLDGGFLMLVGVISYHPGESVDLADNDPIEITEDTAEYFKRIVRVGIPFSLASSGSVEEIVEFLEESGDTESEEIFDMDQYSNEPKFKSALSDVDGSGDLATEDFKLDDLSPAQLEAFKLFNSGK